MIIAKFQAFRQPQIARNSSASISNQRRRIHLNNSKELHLSHARSAATRHHHRSQQLVAVAGRRQESATYKPCLQLSISWPLPANEANLPSSFNPSSIHEFASRDIKPNVRHSSSSSNLQPFHLLRVWTMVVATSKALHHPIDAIGRILCSDNVLHSSMSPR